MTVNCGFHRVIPGQRRRLEHRNVTGISLSDDLSFPEIKAQLMTNAPEGEGWRLTGYAVVYDSRSDPSEVL